MPAVNIPGMLSSRDFPVSARRIVVARRRNDLLRSSSIVLDLRRSSILRRYGLLRASAAGYANARVPIFVSHVPFATRRSRDAVDVSRRGRSLIKFSSTRRRATDKCFINVA